MHETTIRWSEVLSGELQRPILGYGFESYLRNRGARVRTNLFRDKTFVLTENDLVNLRLLIASGRRQEFERLIIVLDAEDVNPNIRNIHALMPLERVVIIVDEEQKHQRVFVYYPERIWLESAYWRARQRTPLHANYISKEELEPLRKEFTFTPPEDDIEKLTLRAVIGEGEIDP